jgi:hypothetical protein
MKTTAAVLCILLVLAVVLFSCDAAADNTIRELASSLTNNIKEKVEDHTDDLRNLFTRDNTHSNDDDDDKNSSDNTSVVSDEVKATRKNLEEQVTEEHLDNKDPLLDEAEKVTEGVMKPTGEDGKEDDSTRGRHVNRHHVDDSTPENNEEKQTEESDSEDSDNNSILKEKAAKMKEWFDQGKEKVKQIKENIKNGDLTAVETSDAQEEDTTKSARIEEVQTVTKSQSVDSNPPVTQQQVETQVDDQKENTVTTSTTATFEGKQENAPVNIQSEIVDQVTHEQQQQQKDVEQLPTADEQSQPQQQETKVEEPVVSDAKHEILSRLEESIRAENLQKQIEEAKEDRQLTKQYAPELIQESDSLISIAGNVKSRVLQENKQIVARSQDAVSDYVAKLLDHDLNKDLFTEAEQKLIVDQALTFDFMNDIITTIGSDSDESFLNLMENSVQIVKKGKDRKHRQVLDQEKARIEQGGGEYVEERGSTPVGTRSVGSDFLAPASSCKELFQKGDDGAGVRWLHTSPSLSTFFTRQVMCVKGWDLIALSGKDNVRAFDFESDVNEGHLYRFNIAGGFAQLDLSRYQTYGDYLLKIEQDGSDYLLKSSCALQKTKNICQQACPCETSADGVNWTQVATIADDQSFIPTKSVLVFVQPL